MEIRITTIVGMIAFAGMMRLLQHLPNFTAVTAMAQFVDRRPTLLVPLVAMFLADLALTVSYHLTKIVGATAIRFFQSTLVGVLFYATDLFGSYEVSRRAVSLPGSVR